MDRTVNGHPVRDNRGVTRRFVAGRLDGADGVTGSLGSRRPARACPASVRRAKLPISSVWLYLRPTEGMREL
jgi:hypothetical protein